MRPGSRWRSERRPGSPAARDRTAPPPATGLPGPAIDATLSRWAAAARDRTVQRDAVALVRTATDLYDRADALREIVT